MAVPANVIAVVEAPSQIVCELIALTDGGGVTTIVKFCGVPGQFPNVGVTIIVEVLLVVPVFVPTKEAMLPDPPAPKPVVVLLFTQLKVAPAVPVKFIAEVLCPAQMV